MKYCPKCKDNVLCDTYKFCSKDGIELKPALKCDCGQEIFTWTKFCQQCGKEAKHG